MCLQFRGFFCKSLLHSCNVLGTGIICALLLTLVSFGVGRPGLHEMCDSSRRRDSVQGPPRLLVCLQPHHCEVHPRAPLPRALSRRHQRHKTPSPVQRLHAIPQMIPAFIPLRLFHAKLAQTELTGSPQLLVLFDIPRMLSKNPIRPIWCTVTHLMNPKGQFIE